MKNKNLIRFVQSLLFLPVMSMPLSFGSIHNYRTPPYLLVQKVNTAVKDSIASNQATDSAATNLALKAQTLKLEADAIDAYFKAHDMPLAGTGMKMAQEADKNGLDWRLLPAIAVRESTGGKFDCNGDKHNAFGWGSCKIGFKSDAHAIETIARNLGGNNPATANYYDNKTTKQILNAYNPPSIVPKYTDQVISIMDAIGDTDMATTTAPTAIAST